MEEPATVAPPLAVAAPANPTTSETAEAPTTLAPLPSMEAEPEPQATLEMADVPTIPVPGDYASSNSDTGSSKAPATHKQRPQEHWTVPLAEAVEDAKCWFSKIARDRKSVV